ncbi:MAG: molybdenum cofactor biosynthesis protein MoaE, partial [Candidatus Thermoplasmatota archaeon]|nr:molybdenum cofactor biosynthesis protein MoaE [Candidatus Thermoplasmatota archaeon]
MRSLRITMGRHIIIEEAPDALDHEALREQLETEGCGAIVSFLGITRGTEGDAEVYALEFDAWQEKLGPVLRDLANQACDTFGALSVAMAHRTGRVEPQESIVSIHVASPHRKEAFRACEWLINELKKQAPLWKREVTSQGST